MILTFRLIFWFILIVLIVNLLMNRKEKSVLSLILFSIFCIGALIGILVLQHRLSESQIMKISLSRDFNEYDGNELVHKIIKLTEADNEHLYYSTSFNGFDLYLSNDDEITEFNFTFFILHDEVIQGYEASYDSKKQMIIFTHCLDGNRFYGENFDKEHRKNFDTVLTGLSQINYQKAKEVLGPQSDHYYILANFLSNHTNIIDVSLIQKRWFIINNQTETEITEDQFFSMNRYIEITIMKINYTEPSKGTRISYIIQK